jgi:hypothetical protein
VVVVVRRETVVVVLVVPLVLLLPMTGVGGDLPVAEAVEGLVVVASKGDPNVVDNVGTPRALALLSFSVL